MVLIQDCGGSAKLQLKAEPVTEASILPARRRKNPALLACDHVSISTRLVSSAQISNLKVADFFNSAGYSTSGFSV